jgi:iduronate 2-sulfatase
MKAAGQKTDALVEFVDIFPSLAELAHLPPPPGLEGKSFAPLLDNPALPWKKSAISEYPKGGKQGTALRTDRYRYVEWHDKSGQLADRELYDHQTDPQENQNIAGRPENAALLETLAAELQASRTAHKAQ